MRTSQRPDAQLRRRRRRHADYTIEPGPTHGRSHRLAAPAAPTRRTPTTTAPTASPSRPTTAPWTATWPRSASRSPRSTTLPPGRTGAATTDEDTASRPDAQLRRRRQRLARLHDRVRARRTETDRFEATSRTYTPDADYNGTDSFTFTATDGTVDSNVATVQPHRQRGQRRPDLLERAATTTDEDTPVGRSTLSCADVDGDRSTYTIVVRPRARRPDRSRAPAAPTRRTPTTTAPTASPSRPSDGTVDSNVATFSLTINAVNDAPDLLERRARRPTRTRQGDRRSAAPTSTATRSTTRSSPSPRTET